MLVDKEVVVWKAVVSPAGGLKDARLEWARAWLRADELERAGRVRAGVARDEFVLGRGMLRALLVAATGLSAGEVELEAGASGKPRLRKRGVGGSINDVEFNVAHSGGVVLIALCRGGEVGVDVERVDRQIEALEIAEKNFAEGERRALAEVSEPERAAEFCRIWAKKEAVVKAHGQGLTLGLDGFDVSARGGVTVDAGGGSYFVRELEAGEGFAAAVAVQGWERPVRVVAPDAILLREVLRGGGRLLHV